MAQITGVTETVATEIKEILLSGKIQKGDKLPSETALADRLKVSRSSVREALRLLSAWGYIELIPNRGAFALVTNESELPSPRTWLELNREMVDEFLSVRSCIEPFAAELCASNISSEGIAKLEELLDKFESAVKSCDWELLSKYDLEFHRTILNESRNRYLIQIYQPLLEAFMQYSRRSMAATYTQSNTHNEHRAIFTAIAQHSPEEAGAAMRLHITIAKRRVKFI